MLLPLPQTIHITDWPGYVTSAVNKVKPNNIKYTIQHACDLGNTKINESVEHACDLGNNQINESVEHVLAIIFMHLSDPGTKENQH